VRSALEEAISVPPTLRAQVAAAPHVPSTFLGDHRSYGSARGAGVLHYSPMARMTAAQLRAAALRTL